MTVFITMHALERLRIRSRQHQNNLRKLVAAGAYVNLGSTTDTCFVLVYSPTDKACLIVLLSRDGQTVISVWPDSFALPKGMSDITAAMKQSAEQRYKDFIFSECVEVPEITPLQITLRIESEHNHKLRSLSSGHSLTHPKSRRLALVYLRPYLIPIVTPIVAQPTAPIQYTALFRIPDGTIVAEHTWRHNKKLRKFLKRNQ